MLSRYLPEGFDWEKVPKPIRDAVQEFLSTLYLERLENRRLKDEWNPISAVIFREKCGSKDKADKARWWAVDNGLAECDRLYRKGVKCLGYRLAPDLQETTFRLHPITDKAFIKRTKDSPRLCTTRLHRHLEKQLRRIKAEIPGNLPVEDAQVLQLVNDGGRVQNPEDKSGGRFFSNVTNMKKELRKHLRVDGERLMEVNVRNCQPLTLVPVLEEQGVECPEYRRLCEEGTLYDFLADKAGISRDQAKRELIACTFFGRNGSRSATKTAFRKAFPKVAKAIRTIKQQDYTELATRLQRAESNLIIRTACDRLRKEHPKMFCTPIHDSVVAKPADIETVACIVREAFASIGLSPKIEAKWL